MSDFDNIRCYDAEDLPEVFDALLADPQFVAVLPTVVGDIPKDVLRVHLSPCTQGNGIGQYRTGY